MIRRVRLTAEERQRRNQHIQRQRKQRKQQLQIELANNHSGCSQESVLQALKARGLLGQPAKLSSADYPEGERKLAEARKSLDVIDLYFLQDYLFEF